MQPIEYTLNLQRILLVILGISILGICVLLVFFDPFSQFFAFCLILANFVAVLAIVQIFLLFWWYFFVKKVILTISQVNLLCYQSLTISEVLTYLLILWHTGSLNNFSFAMVIFMISIYLLFLRL